MPSSETFIGLFTQCGDMTFGQIGYVDEITHSSTIRSRIVIPEHVQMRQVTTRDALDIRHQIVGDSFGILSYHPCNVCSDRIEITQAHRRHLLLRVSLILQNYLDLSLSSPIRVGGLNHVFLVSYRLVSINCGRG